MESHCWFVFAGGGTGGHLFPALGVVELLRERGEGIDVSFFCTQRAIDRDILGKAGVESIPLAVQPFPSRPWCWPAFLRKWRQSTLACRRAFTERRPAVVVGAGGYASGPPVATAIRMGIPTFVLNPDAVPGRANRHLAGRSGLSGIFAQWPVTREHFPARAPVVVTGCPVRRVFTCDSGDGGSRFQGEIRTSFGLEADRPVLLVTGASQGARTLNEAMMQLGGVVASVDWQVLHLSGEADRDRVAGAYGDAGARAVVLDFTDRMADAMRAADLIISRAGASSLAEILAIGRPSILLPYPFHRDRHQWHNGAVLVEAGAAVMLEDRRDALANAGELAPMLARLMTDDQERARMAAAAAGLGSPGAAAVVADRLCQAAGLRRDRACEIP